MSDVLDDTDDLEDNDGEEEEEGGEGEEEESEEGEPEAWETENGVVFELHAFEDHDEILVFEEPEDGTPAKDVAIALSIDDLDEAVEVLKEIREKMVERQTARSPGATAKTPKPKLVRSTPKKP